MMLLVPIALDTLLKEHDDLGVQDGDGLGPTTVDRLLLLVEQEVQEYSLVELMECVVAASAGGASVAGEELEERSNRVSSVTLPVIVRTVRFLALGSLAAGVHLVVQGVILLLLPPVAELAAVLAPAPVSISLHEVLSLPLRALLPLVLIEMRLAAEVLPIVRIYTRVSRVRRVRVGAPHCLEVKHVEIRRLLH